MTQVFCVAIKCEELLKGKDDEGDWMTCVCGYQEAAKRNCLYTRDYVKAWYKEKK